MTIEQRKKQLKFRKALFFATVVLIVTWIPFFTKYFGCSACTPVGGYTAYLTDITCEAFTDDVVVETEEVEIVEQQADEPDNTCWKKYDAKKFRNLGRVKYGSYTYTWYSEKVLPGGGLNKYINGRHNELIDGLEFVCDEDGYIVVACDFLPRYTIVETPVGRKGIVIDTGAGKNNIDLYVGW